MVLINLNDLDFIGKHLTSTKRFQFQCLRVVNISIFQTNFRCEGETDGLTKVLCASPKTAMLHLLSVIEFGCPLLTIISLLAFWEISLDFAIKSRSIMACIEYHCTE